MRYFVAHLLTGEAKAYHERLARELSARFHTFPIYERAPPHITVKPPFDADTPGVEEVERVLRAFARNEKAAPLNLEGFGRFGFKTIYLDVSKSPEAVSLVRKAVSTLNANVQGLPVYPLEGNKLHAAIARFLTRRQHRHIWKHLREHAPRFVASFDSISILEKRASAWTVRTTIALPQERGDAFSGFPGAPLRTVPQ